MKTVFSNRELVHIFAAQKQESGRGSNMHFEGNALYSYNTVIFRLCEFKGKQYLLENARSYSNTTGKHKSYAWRALHHIEPKFMVDDGGMGARLEFSPKGIVDYYTEQGKEKAKETHKLRRKQHEIYCGAISRLQEAIRAAEFFGMGTSRLKGMVEKMEKLAQPFKEDYDKFEAGKADRAEAREETRRKREAESNRIWVRRFLESDVKEFHGHVPARSSVAEDLLDEYDRKVKSYHEYKLTENKEKLEQWMRGEIHYFTDLYHLPVRLRANNEIWEKTIETSHGAVIPYEEGRKAFKFIIRFWKSGKEWRRNGEQFSIGNYDLVAVQSDKIVAGCHTIERSTIEAFAQKEGWIQSTEGETNELQDAIA